MFIRIQVLFIVMIACIFNVRTSFAQRNLSGKVIAADTKKPVANANVYLSTTSIGTITNEKGEFRLDRIPAGRFDMIVSCVGFEANMVKLEQGTILQSMDIILKPKIVELDEVVVRSYDKNGWEKWGQLFLDNFIGTAAFSWDCTLKNKETLRFHLDKKTNVLSVSADDRLIIENQALGYNLKYDLSGFEYNLGTRDFYYGGYPFFEEMETEKARLRKKWKENRQTAYYGSIMHFMRSVFNNRLAEEKFEVRNMVMVSEEEKQRVKILYKSFNSKKPTHDRTIIVDAKGKELAFDNKDPYPDTAEYYKKVMDLPAAGFIVLNKLLTADSISYPEDNTARLFTFTNKLNIIYTPKKNPPEYQRYVSRALTYSPVISEIQLIAGKDVKALSNGSYFDGANLVTYGYWSWWEKMCDKLPYDYIPPPK